MIHPTNGSTLQIQLRMITLLLALIVVSTPALSQISVQVGPTAIGRGEATGERDITISNGLFALAFAVDSAPPWGVARGGIVDVAIVRDGQIGNDFASLVDFMPNDWSAWPTSYQQVDIVKQTEHELTIRTRRDWGQVELETHFQVRHMDSRVHITTEMHNTSEQVLADLSTGYVAWPDGGYLFVMPGAEGQKRGKRADVLADWSASYDKDWAMGLHAPFAQEFRRFARDRYQLHTLKPGERKTFEAWLQIEKSGDLATMVRSEIEFQQLPSGTVTGEVRNSSGELIEQPAVVVLKNERTYAWTLGKEGRYSLELPVGEYQIYATAEAHAPGPNKSLKLEANSTVELYHLGLRPPAELTFEVVERNSGKPLDARIKILRGHQPAIKFLGEKVFFTELEQIGKATFSLAPGGYEFELNAGGGFTAPLHKLEVKIEPGTAQSLKVEIPVQIRPIEQHWYSVDLHHHSDVLDGFTAPEYVLRSELAAGMDFSFLSDHNSVVNNPEMKRLSATRSIPFLGSTELSTSWGHFNAYPLDEEKKIDIDVGAATVQELFALARRMGAELLSVNHPYSAYGYFHNLDTQVTRNGKLESSVPGGYDPAFEFAEIQPVADQEGMQENLDTLARVWQLWNVGKPVYLVGASDVHDIWKNQTGAARTYVRIESEPTVENLVAALKQGKTFATQGPLIFPDIDFGSEVVHSAGTELSLSYQLAAVSGLRCVSLIERGKTIQTRDFDEPVTAATQVFEVLPRAETWYSLVVEDADGNFAYSNPIWVKTSQ